MKNILFPHNKNTLTSIKDNTTYSSNYFIYSLINIYKDILLITKSAIYTPSLISLKKTNAMIYIIKKEYFKEILHYAVKYNIIILYKIYLNNYEIEFLKVYCTMKNIKIILISKNINNYEYELYTKNNIYYLNDYTFKIKEYKIEEIKK